MKRFILFGGRFEDIKGGWSDLVEDSEDIIALSLKTKGLDWFQIVDLIERKIVISSMDVLLNDEDGEKFSGGGSNRLPQ